MTRYIDADLLIEEIDGNLTDSIAEGKALEAIDKMPTADVAPVSWIEAYAEELKDHDNSFNMMRYFTIIHMLADWKSEREEE